MGLLNQIPVIGKAVEGYEEIGRGTAKITKPAARYKPTRQAQQARIVDEAATKYHINPTVLWGVYGRETAHGANIKTSSAGARGPFQFEPETAQEYGYPLGVNESGVTNLPAFRKQAEAAAHLLANSGGAEAEHHAGTPRWHELWQEAINAYNTGNRRGKSEYSFAQVLEAGKSFSPAAGYGVEYEDEEEANHIESTHSPGAGESLTMMLEKAGLSMVLVLAGAALFIYGIMVALRPKENAFTLPKMPTVVPA